MLEIRLVSSLEKVGIGQEPTALDREAPIYAFRGETVSFQIAFRDSAAPDVECPEEYEGGHLAQDLESETGRKADDAVLAAHWAQNEVSVRRSLRLWVKETEWDVRIRRVLPVLCRRSCNPDSYDKDYLFYDSRKAPDILRDMDAGEGVPVTGEWQSCWVDVCPAEGQEPGCHIITIAARQIEGDSACSSRNDSAGKTAGDGIRGGAEKAGCRIKGGVEKAEDGIRGSEEKAGCRIRGSEEKAEAGNTDGTENDICVSVKIHVMDAELPKLSIPHTEWFHCDSIADYYGVEVFSREFWRIFENFLDVYVKRGCNTILTPIVTPPLDTEVGGERTCVQLVGVNVVKGEYRLDFTELERFLDICLKHGIEYFEMCHLFTQWGAEAAPNVAAEADGVRRRIFGWDTPSDDGEYLRFLGKLIPALRELLERRGLLSRTFFHISDEPNLNSRHYRNAQEAVRPLLEGCTIIEAVSDYDYYAEGLVDIPVCAVNYMEPFLERRPPKLWSYFCCAQTVEVPNRFISMPSWRNRIYGTLLYWHRIDGFLHWGFNFYNSALSRKRIDPYETVDADEGFPAGDPFLVYPGEGGVPEESIRLMVQEEGINDYRALCLLESRIGRERVMEMIRREAGMELTFRQYPRNAAFFLRLRERISELLADTPRLEG